METTQKIRTRSEIIFEINALKYMSYSSYGAFNIKPMESENLREEIRNKLVLLYDELKMI